MTYISDGLRRRGGSCTVHEDDSSIKCGECSRYIDPGQRYSIGSLVKDRPVCRECQPFDEQTSLLDMLAPERGRRTPAEHLTMEDYQTQGGGYRHREQCAGCEGRGWMWSGLLKVKHSECMGKGWVWKDGRVST